jgi:DNA-binding LacI/PurR family transcriptional regulator
LDVVTLDMGDISEIERALDALLQYDLAGIVAFASTDGTRAVFQNAHFTVPVVVAAETDEPESVDASRVATHGIEDLMDYLTRLGHETFLHIAGPEDWAAARNRLHAFEHAAQRLGARHATVVHGDWSAMSGYEAIEALSDHAMPTAIVAANDQMALGAMHALHERGLRVPEDVSVTGLDDTPEAAYFTPSLTTVRLDFRTQGRDAVRTLLTEIDPGSLDRRHDSSRVQEPTRNNESLIIRKSTAPAAH